ncbi:hypothetical protein NL358_27910, partial [Klebsiella pneumoniae]|nr:hypothetical protein [Klebsiella pneumoniae]
MKKGKRKEGRREGRKKEKAGQFWCMSLNPALRRWRQPGVYDLEASLTYSVQGQPGLYRDT